MKRSSAPCHILKGTWWSNREVPLVLPYFQAVHATHGPLDIGHRTIRSGDDIKYWIKKIPKGSQAFVYLACHGEKSELFPGGARDKVTRADLCSALNGAKDGAIGFLHVGACASVDADNRRWSLHELLEASGAHCVSGYSKYADWLRSTLLDVALVAEVYVPFFNDARRFSPRLSKRLRTFLASYGRSCATWA